MLKQQFPILQQQIHGYPLSYLDNAATTQKPKVVIDAISNYYQTINANINRGAYYLSEQATDAYEQARSKIQRFINAKFSKECIFVQGTTKAINLVAHSFGDKYIDAGDEILISAMEHHANIVPWQLLCERKKANLKILPILDNGELDLSKLPELLTKKTKLVSIVYVSNTLGTINPVKEIINTAHKFDIPVLVDAAQAVAHMPIDVQDLNCDFLAFSAHKMYGPMGIGVLYAKEKWLDNMPPFEGGGDMVLQVTFEKTTFKEAPVKFEPGTMPVAEVIALGAAIDFLNNLDLHRLWQHEQELFQYATKQLQAFSEVQIIGNTSFKVPIISFVMDKIHPHDLCTIADKMGIAMRAGHHCTMPIMDFFKIPATARMSLGIYNEKQDIDQLLQALQQAKKIFNR